MTAWSIVGWRTLALAFVAGVLLHGSSAPFQVVPTTDPAQSPPAGGCGDSAVPVLSPDGRYVFFASTANNLLLNRSNTPFGTPSPFTFNVFLRDRASNTTTLVSVNLTGLSGGNGDSMPSGISTNGRYAAFESSASDLIAGDTNGQSDVFVRDLLNGVTTLVSVSTNGGVGNGASRSPAMTPDGRYVAFVSAANNLVPGDTNGIPDIFIRDMVGGTTTLVSAHARSTNNASYYYVGVSTSESPDITPDGRYVAFYSTAAGMVPGITSVGDVYLWDRLGGSLQCASAYGRTALQAAQGTTRGACYNFALSADGQFVSYEVSPASGAGLILRYNSISGVTDQLSTNAATVLGPYEAASTLDMTPDGQRVAFVANTNVNGTAGAATCIYVWDAQSGSATLASGDLNGAVAAGANCDAPMLDASGRYVAFASTATNMVSVTTVSGAHLYLRDLQTGVTSLLDADTNGTGSTAVSEATAPCLSADGSVVAFESSDGALVGNDRNRDLDLFVRDLASGQTELTSAHAPTLGSVTPNGRSRHTLYSLSMDARYLAFLSEADNLVGNDTNGAPDIFVADLAAGTNVLVSVSAYGGVGNASSSEPAMSADGRYVAFTSGATNLVAGDANSALDVFVRDLQAGTTTLVSVNSTGTGPGNADSYTPVLSGDGRYVSFRSKASNLAAGGFSGENLFVRDLQVGTTVALTSGGLACAATSPDGRFVAFVDSAAAKLYVWDTQTATRVYTNSTSGLSVVAVGISPDGQRLAYSSTSQLYLADRTAGTNGVFLPYRAPSRAGLRFSADGRLLTCAAVVNRTNQVYLYDVAGGTCTLVSRSCVSGLAGAGNSDSPDVSSDGRFVAYRSEASDLVVGDNGNRVNVFLYDQQSGATTLLSASRLKNAAADNHSFLPVFSWDGQTLLFGSWGSDLVAQDFNHTADLFVYSLYYSGAIPVFSAQAIPAGLGQAPALSWPVLPGKAYHVQFKTALGDAVWQDVSGGVTILGTQAWFKDPAPAPGQRFYRVVAF